MSVSLESDELGPAQFLYKEDWRAYVLQQPPLRPQRPTEEQWASWTELERAEFERSREDYHSAFLLVAREQVTRIHHDLARTMAMNRRAPTGARRGHMISGPIAVGKSTAICGFGRDFELDLRRRDPESFEKPYVEHLPVVNISVPDGATPKDLARRIASYLALPVRTRATRGEMVEAILNAFRRCGTQLVIFDDINFLDLSRREGREANVFLKHLANHCSATFVYVGVELESSGLLREGGIGVQNQTAARFQLHTLTPFCDALDLKKLEVRTATQQAQVAEWVSLLRAFEEALTLWDHEPGTLPAMWGHLLQRTGGRMLAISALIRGSAIEAIRSGRERIDRQTLDAMGREFIDERAPRGGT